MSSPSQRRIIKELQDMSRDTSSGMEASVIDPQNMTHLIGRFKGPPDTPYENGEFAVDIQLPDNYPFSPPKMKFSTKVWHPNISSQTGAICLDTLSAKWTPVLTIKTALLSLQSLLSAPEPSDPQDAEVATMMLSDPEAFKRKAREWAIHYANAPSTAQQSRGPSVEERRQQEKERELQGYDERTVDRFMDMGFSVSDVVVALRRVGVRPGQGRLSEEVAQRVAEKLLGL
ncbi:hypothetical protein L211DRAFT_856131 [Terfezia boudieri ATCC MYA-4762]|uniref:Ubiquitin-conjugating enzyme E2 1 n=1 Tax=Terfezia boudieri ATCC MYA-4762 TaxID=1051890 RepID=A0A3N4MAZ4_9PEZI|nr:hypothetical protein L211DRAFT_856131 [Terfezia boudieri ATCC MYA-4762]